MRPVISNLTGLKRNSPMSTGIKYAAPTMRLSISNTAAQCCNGGRTSSTVKQVLFVSSPDNLTRCHYDGLDRDISVLNDLERHMKYWIDTEFIEHPCTIDLISIGLVAEDGREFYAESSEVDWTKASQWTLQTVRPQLGGAGMPREDIGNAVRRFLDADKAPVFWGYFPSYDWVTFT